MWKKKLKSIERKAVCMTVLLSLLGTVQSPVWAETAQQQIREIQAVQEEKQELSEAENSAAGQEDVLPQPEETAPEKEEEWIQEEDPADTEESSASEEEETEVLPAEEEISDGESGENRNDGQAVQEISTYTLENVRVSVTSCNQETGEFTVRIQGVQLKTGEALIVPIWTSSDQKDIIWHTAKKEGTDYIVKDSSSAHGYRAGVYHVHVYKKGTEGTMSFLTNTKADLQLKASDLKIDYKVGGKALLALQDVSFFGTVSEVRYAVWTAVNGQDDIRWYRVTDGSGSSWSREIDPASHKGDGTLYVHAYAYTKAGQSFCVKTGSFEKNQESTEKNITVKGPEQGSGSFTVTIGGVPDQDVKAVMVPVWSRSDQSDIVWYTAVKEGTQYTVKSSLSSHQWNTGTYQIHVYTINTRGEMKFFGSQKMTVAAPAAGSFTAKVTETGFKLTAADISSSIGITEVQVPVWSRSDQSDIVWYRAKQVNGTYVVESDISAHKNHYGTYQAHLYVRGNDSRLHYLGKTSFQIQDQAQTPVLTAEKAGAADRFTIRLKQFTGEGEVKFAVWSKEKGQDDIQWYTAEKKDTEYRYEVSDPKHRTNGTVYIHAYLFPKGKSAQFIGGIEYQMHFTTASEVKITDINNEAGSFRIHVTAGSDISPKAVTVAVWSRSDQSNIKWYQAQKQTDGTWTAVMNRENHGDASGTYQVHVYGVLADGSMKLLCHTTAVLKEENRVVTEMVSTDKVRITVYDAYWKGNAVSVLMPAWSEEKGQDDIVWYRAEKQADGSFQAVISLDKHKHSGNFITHIYVSNGTEQGLVKALKYSLTADSGNGGVEREFDAEARLVMRNIIYAVETGGQVYGGHRYDCFVEAYTNSSIETAITIGAGGWFAGEAKTLLSKIRTQYPDVFEEYDTAEIGEDLDTENWKYYGGDGAGGKTILKGSDKAVAIQKIISTPEGCTVQDSLVDEQMVKYADQAKALGVTDLKARLFCANIQHLGGYNAMVRVINYCISDEDPLTMESMWENMREREAGSGNTVGADKYRTRHQKVMQWLNTYL
ncbi:MAG: GBS Bsp-like repeat-containing protein [Lachnospiraceae bacterium]|nr:GBS Bsp-like repeat-containing protein [Lachnospiraceae bacterium]